MTQEWGPNYYHFTVEHLPRIMVFLDVLLENEDIRVSSEKGEGVETQTFVFFPFGRSALFSP